MKIREDSLLYHFVKTYAPIVSTGYEIDYRVRNLCDLLRGMFLATGSVLLILVVSFVFGIFFITAFLGFYFSLTTSLSLLDCPSSVVMLGAIAILSIATLWFYVKDNVIKRVSNKSDSLITNIYKQIRDKTCILVEFEKK